MLQIILMACTGMALATPSHLKPGALTAPIGRVTLVQDVLTVKYSLTTLHSLTPELEVFLMQMDNMVQEIDKRLAWQTDARPYVTVAKTLNLIKGRISFLNNILAIAMHDFRQHPMHARVKRGLVDLVGYGARMLIGTAMDEDVQDLRQRYSHLLSIAETNKRFVNLNHNIINSLRANVQNLLEYSNQLRDVLDNVNVKMEDLTKLVMLDQAIAVTETRVNNILNQKKTLIANLLDASDGRVTNSLMPIADLLEVLDIGLSQYDLKPIFSGDSIQHYYPLLESILTLDAIIIFIPFNSKEIFQAYEVIPFPFKLNSSVLTVDLPSSLVLVAEDFSVYATAQREDLAQCHTSYHQLYHCIASLFAFRPLIGDICEIILTQEVAKSAIQFCPYKHIVPSRSFHKLFRGYQYFLFTKPTQVAVVCQTETTYRRVEGHLAVPERCQIRSSNLTTFPSRVHEVFTANMSLGPIFPLSVIQNMSLIHIPYVTNSLHELTFSNTSQFVSVLEDSLPDYLNPVVHFPSIIVPIIILICILIPVLCCVKKALTLYSHLNIATAARRNVSSASSSSP